MHNYSYDQEHCKVMVYAYLKLWIRVFQGYVIEHSKVYDFYMNTVCMKRWSKV
jgi:hypothetical protein